MPRDSVYVIVEGHGEADPPGIGGDPAAKILVARLLQHVQCWHLHVAKRTPYRLRSCGDFYPRTDNLVRVLRAHSQYEDCAAVVVLFDLDDGCPAVIGPAVARRIRGEGPWPFPIAVVCAHREYESWFLASLETIHVGRSYLDDPEALRDAKGWLSREFGYREVRDQATYTRRLGIEAAMRSRSFRRLIHAVEELVAAGDDGATPVSPADTTTAV